MTRTSTTKLILSSFTYYLGYSSFTTFLSLYLIKVGYVEYEIGFILTYASLTGIIGSYISFLLLEKYSSKKISIIITLLKCFCYFLLGFISYQLGVIILIAILYLLQSIFRSSFGLLFKESSKSGNYNKNQGYLFAIINLGWFFGPFISGIIANNIGISYVFIFSGFITLLSVILIYFTSYKHIKIHKKLSVLINLG